MNASLRLACLLPCLLAAAPANAQIVPDLPVEIVLEQDVTVSGFTTRRLRRQGHLNVRGDILVYAETDNDMRRAREGYFLWAAGTLTQIVRENDVIDVAGAMVNVMNVGSALDAPEPLSNDGSFAFFAVDSYYLYRRGAFSLLASGSGADPLGNPYTGLGAPALANGTGSFVVRGTDSTWLFDGEGGVDTLDDPATDLSVIALADNDDVLLGDATGFSRWRAGSVTPIFTLGGMLDGGIVEGVGGITMTPSGDVYAVVTLRAPAAADCALAADCTRWIYHESGGVLSQVVGETTLPGTGGRAVDLLAGLHSMTVGPDRRLGLGVSLVEMPLVGAVPVAALLVDRTDVTVIAASGDAASGSGGEVGISPVLVLPAGPDRTYVEMGIAPIGVEESGDGSLWVYESGALAPLLRNGVGTATESGVRTPNATGGIVLRGPTTAGAGRTTNAAGTLTVQMNLQESGTAIFRIGAAPPSGADVAASGSATAVGRRITYQMTITNNGPEPIHDYLLALDLPAGFVVVTPPEAPCSWPAPGEPIARAVCEEDLGLATALDINESRTFTLVVDASGPGSFDATLTASTATNDPDSTNDTLTLNAVVLEGARSADLQLESVTPMADPQVRDWDYELAVRNLGPDPATEVVVMAALGVIVGPAGVCPTSDRCALGDLAVGEEVVIQATEVNTGAFFEIDMSVSGAEADPDPSNNRVSVANDRTTGCAAAPAPSTSGLGWTTLGLLALFMSWRRRSLTH